MELNPMSLPLPQLMVSVNLMSPPLRAWLRPPRMSSLTWRLLVAFARPPLRVEEEAILWLE